MPYDVELPDGTLITDIPDDVDQKTALTKMGRKDPRIAKFAPKTELTSLPGLISIGTAVKRSVGELGLAGASSAIEEPAVAAEQSRTTQPWLEALQRKYNPFYENDPAIDAMVGAPTDPARQELAGMRKEFVKGNQQTAAVNPSLNLGIVQGTAQNFVQQAPGLLASVASGNPAFALGNAAITTQMSGQEQAIESGVGAEQAAASGALQAIPEVAFELWPMGKLLKELGTDAFVKMAAKFVLREEVTELPTTAAQEIIKLAVERPGESMATFRPRLVEALKDTAIQTPFSAGVTAGAARGLYELGGNTAPIMGDKPRNVPPPPSSVAPTPASVVDGTLPVEDGAETFVDSERGRSLIDALDTVPEEAIAAVIPPAPVQVIPATPSGAALAADINTIVGADIGEFGQSRKAADNAVNYPNPNNAIPRGERIITIGPEETVGQPLQSIDWNSVPPTTVTLGKDTLDRPGFWMKGVANITEALRSTFMPDATFIISNEQIPNDASVGWHYATGRPNTYMIVPAALRRIGEQATRQFNPKTLVKAFYNVFHEFGHALLVHRMFEGMSPESQKVLRGNAHISEMTPEMLAELAAVNPKAAAVVQDWQNRVSRVHDGSMTAKEFIATWWGATKVYHKGLEAELALGPNASALDLVRAVAFNSIQREQDKSGMMDQVFGDLVKEKMRQYLSLDEFVAEQTARYARDVGADITSPFFQDALAKMRAFFRQLKQGIQAPDGTTYSLAAGTTFKEWIESMGNMRKGLNSMRDARIEAKKALTVKGVKVAAKARKAKPQAPPKEKKVAVPKDVSTQAATMLGIVDSIAPSGETNDKIRELIAKGRYDAAADLLAQAMEGKVQWETDETFEDVIDPLEEIKAEDAAIVDFISTNMPKYTREDYELSTQAWILPNGELRERKFHHMPDAMWTMRSLAAGEPVERNALESTKEFFDSKMTDDMWDSLRRVLNAGVVRQTGGAFSFGDMPPTSAQINTILDRAAAKGMAWITLESSDNSAMTFSIMKETEVIRGARNLSKESREKLVKQMELYLLSPRVENVISEVRAKAPWFKLESIKAWNEMREKSPFLIRWFGDWIRFPESASKVVTHDGVPLTVFHAAPKGNSTLQFGDIGYHFGTAHAAGARQHGATQGVDWTVRPYYLSIKKPLDIGSEGATNIWAEPMTLALHIAGLPNSPITMEEVSRLISVGNPQSQATMYEDFTPLRELLRAKGFDGIKYKNEVEGGTSWVAFDQPQVKRAGGVNTTFSSSRSVNWEQGDDFDLTTEEGQASVDMLSRLKRIGLNVPWMREALRRRSKLAAHVLQGQQLAQLNPDSLPFAKMRDWADRFAQKKSSFLMMPKELLDWVRDLGKETTAKFYDILQEEAKGKTHTLTIMERVQGRGWVHQVNPAAHDILRRAGISEDRLEEVYKHILMEKQSITDLINYATNVLADRYFQKYNGTMTPEELRRKVIMEVKDPLDVFAQTPFVPETSFGSAAVIVEEKKANGAWTPIWKRMFESDIKAEAALVDWNRRLAGKPDLRVVSKTRIPEKIGVLMNLPKEFLDVAAEQLGLTLDERLQLEALLVPTKIDRVTERFLQRLPGATKDHMRNYADWMWHTTNAFTKMEYAGKFSEAIRQMGSDVRLARQIEDPIIRFHEERRLSMLEWFMRHQKEYILNPPNEYQALRTSVALFYLWAMPKTALMNMSSLIFTATHLSAKHGLVDGNVRLAKAVEEAALSVAPTKLQKVDEELAEMLQKAIDEGLISESYAYHVAAIANNGTLSRLPSSNRAVAFKDKALEVGMFAFRAVEHGTRRVTFIAMYHEGRDSGMAPEEAYAYAYKMTKAQQNSYNPFDRPVVMQGGLAPFTIFYSFLSHFTFHALGGYETGQKRMARLQGVRAPSSWFGYTMQLLLIVALMSGYEGLPGAESILNLLDPIFRRLFGKPARQFAREGMQEVFDGLGINASPSWAAHGALSSVGLSRSFGFGNIVPGADFFKEGDNERESIANLGLGLMGPLGGVVAWAASPLLSDRSFEEIVKRTPGIMGHVATAVDWSMNGAKGPVGESLMVDEAGNPVEPTAGQIALRGMGFQNPQVLERREMQFAQLAAKNYWSTRRSGLMKDYAKARVEQDREAIADAKLAVKEFNEGLPENWRALRIRGEQLSNAFMARRQEIRARESGRPRQQMYREVYEEIESLYE
jgi:hypothetical protein